MNTVVRDGDTVVRIAGPWTTTVHRYLEYLHVAGIDWVPRPVEAIFGADGHPERERLTYLHGDVPAYPLPSWVWADHVLSDGAQRLRRLHDASVGFSSDGCTWQSPAKIPAEVVCHNDFAPHNLVFREGRITAAIDFDFCSPGPRVWDIAYFATRAVPLTAESREGAPGMDRPGVASRSSSTLTAATRPPPSTTWFASPSSASTTSPRCPAARQRSSTSPASPRTRQSTTATATTWPPCGGELG